MRGDVAVDGLRIRTLRSAYADVGVAKPECRVDVGRDARISLEDLLELDVDELNRPEGS